MKKIYSILFVMLLGFILVACNLEGEEDRTGEQVEITHTITNVLERDQEGNATKTEAIEVTEKVYINPKRVATFHLGMADVFLYVGLDKLGVTHFGVPKGGTPLPETLSEFNKEKYANVGVLHTPDTTALELFNPDLIILDGRTRMFHNDLKERFPNADIVDFSLTTYDFEKHVDILETLALIFPNAKDDFTSKVESFRTTFAEIREKTAGVRLLFVQTNGENLSVATGPNGRYGLVFKEFGFESADATANDKAENSHGTMGANLEYIKDIDPEVIFIIDRNIIAIGEPSPSFKSDSMISSVSAIVNDYVFYLDPTSWYTISGGIRATEQMFADVMQYINAVEAKK